MSPANRTPTHQVRGRPFCLTSAEKGALSKFVNKHRQPADGLIKLWAAMGPTKDAADRLAQDGRTEAVSRGSSALAR